MLQSLANVKTSEPASEPNPDRLQIARFRTALDWMLAHPKWESQFALILDELKLKGQRQGIGLGHALRSLPIDRKFEVVRKALEPARSLAIPSYPEARRLARLWGITRYQARKDFGRPSVKQWQSLRAQLTLVFVSRYESYKRAQSSMYEAHETLPETCLKSICRSTSQFDDALQEARLGLLEAIDRVDPEQSFEAYARAWITRRVRNFLMRSRLPVRAPINLISKTLRSAPGANLALEKAIREGTVLLEEAESHPQLQSVAEQEPDVISAANDEKEKVAEALATLSEKQREVIELRFGLHPDSGGPRSLGQIAKQCGISRQQVHRREQRALQRLLKSLENVASERGDLLLVPTRS